MHRPPIRNLPRLLAATTIAALAIGIAGCGGSDSQPASATGADAAATTSAQASEGNLAGFMRDIGVELNEFWAENWGEGWKPAVVKIPENSASTACGENDATDSGPAYCGADSTMVLPVAFFQDQIIDADETLRNDAAVAGVLGHEFGHHLQTLAGLEDVVDEESAKNPEIANLLSVAYELHADCLMGIWMSSVDDEKRLEPGDLDEVLGALEKIGDDNLTAEAGATADAGTFDHGTSEQRQVWFGVGFSTQDPEACNRVFDDLEDGTLEKELQAGADAVNEASTAE